MRVLLSQINCHDAARSAGPQHWEAAVAYVELLMFSDADAELERIDPFNCAAPEVLAVRIAIYHGMRKWEAMREIAKRLADFDRRTTSGRDLMPTPPQKMNNIQHTR